jgi:hypothetical protein
MKDEFYRKLCNDQSDYDGVIDWIAENNDAAKRQTAKGSAHEDLTPEDWASDIVNSNISSIVFGGNPDVSRGMCHATYCPHPYDKDENGNPKRSCRLSINLIGHYMQRQAAKKKNLADKLRTPGSIFTADEVNAILSDSSLRSLAIQTRMV